MSKKTKRYTIGVDIGGTKVLTALLDEQFKVVTSLKSKVKLSKGRSYFLDTIVDHCRGVIEQGQVSPKKIAAVGVGCPGMIEFPKGIVCLSPNIAFLKNYALQEKLKKRLKIPVFVENDVNAGLYGEYRLGSAKGYKHVFGIFLGTGVGGAMILDGKLFRGVTGGAGEVGHIFLSAGFLNGKNTLEEMVGRHAIASEAALLLLKNKAKNLQRLVDDDVQKIKSGVLAEAVREGDRAVRELILSKAEILGIAMANVVNLLNPELIVLGGGVMEALGQVILPEAVRSMKKHALKPLVKSVHVVPARLKDLSVATGAAKLAHEWVNGEFE